MRTRNSLSAAFITSLLLAACSTTVRQENRDVGAVPGRTASGWYIYANSEFKYSINIPPAAYIPGKSDTGPQIFFGNIPVISKHLKGNEFDVLLYGKNSSCSPSLMGTSKTSLLNLSGDTAQWGKVDWLERWKHDPPAGEGVYCLPSAPATSTYILCSEKNAKTVVICINQVTDNPTLAEEIFKTFRWTK